jgi:ketosteroid isomerase-like protein
MSRENVEVVRQIYAEWAQGNMKAGVDLFDPQIAFESFMPDADQRIVATGAAEVEAFMREFLAQWRDFRIFGDDFRAAGDDTVYVRGRQAATGRGSGIAVEDSLCSVWTFRDGAVVRLLFERDWRRALEAVGLREAPAEIQTDPGPGSR